MRFARDDKFTSHCEAQVFIDKSPGFTIDAKRVNLNIEQDLLIVSKGKLDSKVIDIVPDEGSMSQEEIRTHEHVCRSS